MCLWRLEGRPYESAPRAETSLRFLECPRRLLDGVPDTEDPVCENEGEVYCGNDVGCGAGCCGPVAFRFFGEETWSSQIINTMNKRRSIKACLRVSEADGCCSYLLVMWVVASDESKLTAKIEALVAAGRFAIVLMDDQIVPVIFAY